MEPVSTHIWVRLGVVISGLWEKVDLSVVPVLGDTVCTSSGEIKVIPWRAAEILDVLSIVSSTLGPDLILDMRLEKMEFDNLHVVLEDTALGGVQGPVGKSLVPCNIRCRVVSTVDIVLGNSHGWVAGKSINDSG